MNIEENYLFKRLAARMRSAMPSGGSSGPAGPAGKDGRDGVDGKDGSTGAASTVPGPKGEPGKDGKDGAKGADSIVPGPAGANGKDGANGAAGAAGKDAVIAAASFGSRTPALNAAFQISATRDAQVTYPIDVTINSLLTDVDGVAFLEYADTAAMTSATLVMSAGQLLGGVLNIKNRGTVTLMGRIPSGKFVRIRTVNVVGVPVFAARQGQEILL